MFLGDLPPMHLSSTETEIHASIESPCVVEIFSLQEIDTNASTPGKEVRLVLDIDDTIYVHGQDGQFFSLGSKAWRADIKSQIHQKLELWLQENPDIQKQIPSDHSLEKIAQNLHDYLTWFLTLQMPVETVESDTAAWIQDKQSEGIDTSLLTGRETATWHFLRGVHVTQTDGLPVADVTVEQLQSLGININHDGPFPPQFFDRGIHFVPHNGKGDYFTEIMLPALQTQGLNLNQVEFIFIDDKKAQSQSMADAFSKAGIAHRCYYYRASEKFDAQYNSQIASIQLYTLWQFQVVLSDNDAKNLVNPERGPDEYLRAVVLEALKAYYGPLEN